MQWTPDFINGTKTTSFGRGDVRVKIFLRNDDPTVSWEQGGGPELFGTPIDNPKEGCLVTEDGRYFMPAQTAARAFDGYQHNWPKESLLDNRIAASGETVFLLEQWLSFMKTWCFHSYVMQIWYGDIMLYETPRQATIVASKAEFWKCFVDHHKQAIDNAKNVGCIPPADIYAMIEASDDIEEPEIVPQSKDRYFPWDRREWVQQGEQYEEPYGPFQIGVQYLYEHTPGGFWKGYYYTDSGRWKLKGDIQAPTFDMAMNILASTIATSDEDYSLFGCEEPYVSE